MHELVRAHILSLPKYPIEKLKELFPKSIEIEGNSLHRELKINSKTVSLEDLFKITPQLKTDTPGFHWGCDDGYIPQLRTAVAIVLAMNDGAEPEGIVSTSNFVNLVSVGVLSNLPPNFRMGLNHIDIYSMLLLKDTPEIMGGQMLNYLKVEELDDPNAPILELNMATLGTRIDRV